MDTPRSEAIQGGDRGDLYRRQACATDGRPRAKPEALRPCRCECEHGVAIGKQQLAIRNPYRIISEVFGMGEKVDFINVGHHANAELHVSLLRITPIWRVRPAVLRRPVPDSHWQ